MDIVKLNKPFDELWNLYYTSEFFKKKTENMSPEQIGFIKAVAYRSYLYGFCNGIEDVKTLQG